MTSLITLAEAKKQLRVETTDEDAVIWRMCNQATEIVIDYIKRLDHGWTLADVPYLIQAAIMLVMTALYEGRSGDTEILSDAVKNLVHRYRDPALA